MTFSTMAPSRTTLGMATFKYNNSICQKSSRTICLGYYTECSAYCRLAQW
jgi:hypothetical protein